MIVFDISYAAIFFSPKTFIRSGEIFHIFCAYVNVVLFMSVYVVFEIHGNSLFNDNCVDCSSKVLIALFMIKIMHVNYLFNDTHISLNREVVLVASQNLFAILGTNANSHRKNHHYLQESRGLNPSLIKPRRLRRGVVRAVKQTKMFISFFVLKNPSFARVNKFFFYFNTVFVCFFCALFKLPVSDPKPRRVKDIIFHIDQCPFTFSTIYHHKVEVRYHTHLLCYEAVVWL